MMEFPSAAAHSHALNAVMYPTSKETKTVAPFPDMGMGMPSNVVDLTIKEEKHPSIKEERHLSIKEEKHPTIKEEKPSPRVQAGTIKSGTRAAPSTNAKPSPRPTPKPTPPTKVTPVPPPQIPRLQASQFSTASNQSKSQPAPQPSKALQPTQPTQPLQQAPAVRTVQNNALDSMLGLPPTGAGDGTTSGGNGELNFTDMEFSLAPPPSHESQGAPPAPMPEFDLATFAPQGRNNSATVANMAGNNPTGTSNTNSNSNSNMDDLFNLGDANGGGDNMFDLGGGEVNDSTFDDMMFFGNNDSDMAQFDDAYFGI
jgi:hypothetical protein